MQVNLPQCEQYNRVRLTVNTPQDSKQMVFGEPHKVANIKLPEGVEEREVEVVGQFMDNGSRVVGEEMLLKSPTPPQFKVPATLDAEPELASEPEPKSWDDLSPEKQAEALVHDQNQPEVNDEEAHEEAREEDVHELVEGTPEPVQDVVEDAPEPAVEQVQEVKKSRRRRSK